MRVNALRFRLLVVPWLARRWPRNPFLFFIDVLTLLIDLVCFVALPRGALCAVLGDYAARLDIVRLAGVIGEPGPRATRALRWARGAEADL